MEQLQKMSETEKKIMDLVWQAEPPVTVSEIQQMAGDMKAWKHTTIATFLQNLCQKGVLRVVKKGNTNLYYPQITKADYMHFETITFLQTVHQGSLKSFMSALLGGTDICSLEPAQIDELKEMLKKL